MRIASPVLFWVFRVCARLPQRVFGLSSQREAQDGFASAHDTYIKAKADKGESASSLKKPIVSLINDNIVPYLNIVAAMEGYADFIAAVAGNIKSTNDTVARRAASGKKEEE